MSKFPVKWIFLALAVTCCQFNLVQGEEKKEAAKKVNKITFDDHIQPILRTKCLSCHNPNKKSSGLDMSSYTSLMVGGSSGEVIEPGSADDSYLYLLVTHESEPFMPPKSDKMSTDILNKIRDWINAGAPENSGSKPLVSKKPKFNLALAAPGGKPEVAPMPGRLSLEPLTQTVRTGAVTALASNPWSPIIAIAGQKQILLYNSKSLELVGTLAFPEGIAHSLKFSRNGNLLLAGGGRGASLGKTVVWNLKTGERIIEIGDELDTVLGADISADQTLIALGSSAKVIRVYSTRTGELEYEIPKKHTGWIYCVSFSPDGVLLATGDKNGGVFVWEAETGRQYLQLKAHNRTIRGLSWRSDSNILASCSADGSIRLWEMENGGQVKNWGAHGGGCLSVEFARDGRLLSCGRDKVTKLWDQNGKQLRAFEALSEIALQVTFCDETNRAIAGDWNGEIRVWDASDGKRLGNLTSNPLRLQQRLEASNKQLVELKAKHEPLAKEATASQTALKKVETDLANGQKLMVVSKQTVETTTAKIATYQKTIATLTAEYQAAAKVVTALEPVVPLLKESLTKAQAAAAKATGDKEVAELAAKLLATSNARNTTLEENRKLAATKNAALTKEKATLATAEKELATAQANLKQAQEAIAKATAALKPARVKAAYDKARAEEAAQAVASTEQQVKRWQDEIAFVKLLTELFAKRSAAEEKLLTQQEQLAQLTGKANEVKAVYTTAKNNLDAAEKVAVDSKQKYDTTGSDLEKSKQALTQAETDHSTTMASAEALEKALVPLKQAIEQAGIAAEKSGGDKELVQVVTTLKSLSEKKTIERDTKRKSLPDKLAVINKAKQTVGEVEKRLTASKTVLDGATKTVTEMAKVAKSAQDNMVASDKEVVTATAKAATDQKTVDQVNQELDVARTPKSAAVEKKEADKKS
ncbi:MAG TPA: hypothetical protein EYN70_14525 [Planctomycetaceae bacterium]|nr:hypothetical protein [Planctomycetaceae bacterium]